MADASTQPSWPRPRPVVGDASAAHERADDPAGWAFDGPTRAALDRVVGARRDIRRFRPDPVDDELLRTVLAAGHAGPSVGHSQPWRFIVVRDPATRDAAAVMADRCRLAQAAQMEPDRARRLLDLKLEGLREAPVGVVVACDRRAAAAGVLGRATFPDTDLWSCAAAIENMWLTARAAGLGMGWVTLFEPAELNALLGLPEGVETLGWLCLGWPDERPPSPGLERMAWSRKLPLDDVVLAERWPSDEPSAPTSHLRAPGQQRMVGATDAADDLLTPPGSLGALDRAVDRMAAVLPDGPRSATLVLAGADHPVAALGVSAFEPRVTHDVMTAGVRGTGLGAVAATGAGLDVVVVDAGVTTPVDGAHNLRPTAARGDLATRDALGADDVQRLLDQGEELARGLSGGLVALGEVGIGNTTVAAVLAAALLGLDEEAVVGLGAGSDSAILGHKRDVVRAALARWRAAGQPTDRARLLGMLGGGEFAVLTGVVLGAARSGSLVVLDGLATSVCALLAVRDEPGVQAYLVAGQRSREQAHPLVLDALGLEPVLDLRMRCGEGVGASLASSLLLQGQRMRQLVARTH